MKKIIILLITLLPVLGFAQKAKKDIQKTSFEVNGVCGMCKARIEKQAFTIKGVKSATWDIPSQDRKRKLLIGARLPSNLVLDPQLIPPKTMKSSKSMTINDTQ